VAGANNIPGNLQVNQLIIVSGASNIAGAGELVAPAGPCSQRTRADDTRDTINGQIQFDSSDFMGLIDKGGRFNVIPF
jgi:hypothetical protein